MRTFIIGIDGLETTILDQYYNDLPNFKKIKERGYLNKVNSVFPADSVPAWITIYTGLNPSFHGIVRGKDYIESVNDFEKLNNFKLEGKTFWDKLGLENKRSLILNPFLAYPAWNINGTMISGPAFIEGDVSKFPINTKCNPDVYGGYKTMGSVSQLQSDMSDAINNINLLWKEFKMHFSKEHYDLAFVLFTEIDRIQHYTFRYFDKNDPLYKNESKLSGFILEGLKALDNCLGELLEMMDNDDYLLIISDHGFGRRPYDLLNFNELLRQNGLLIIKESQKGLLSKIKQKFRNYTIKVLSDLKILDIVSGKLKKIKKFNKYKKSSFLIDEINSICYLDELFSGKKPYCGLRFGEKFKESSDNEKRELINQLSSIFDKYPELPKPIWIKLNPELFTGPYADHYPDICIELPKEYGVEFEVFGKLITSSSTHYKISGGHYGSGTFAFYNPNGVTNKIKDLEEFHNQILKLFQINN